MSRLSDRFAICIQTNDTHLRKRLGERQCDASDAAPNVHDTTASFQTLDDLRQRLEPMRRKALLVLASIEHVQRLDAISTVVREWHSAALFECQCDARCDAQYNERHTNQSAQEMIRVIGGQQEG